MTLTPTSVFLQWLGARARDCRMAVAVDSDSLLTDAGVLGRLAIVDDGGRTWRPVVFRGDDLAFRMRFRATAGAGPVVVVLGARPQKPDANGNQTPVQIDASWVADILALNEGGEPLDLSLPAFFRRICPRINFPETPLRRYRDALMDRLEVVPAAAAKIVQRWGKPDDWGNGQIAALALLAGHPVLTLHDIWPDETRTDAFVEHGLRLLLGTPALSADRSVVIEILREAAQPQVMDGLRWFDLPPAELASYIVLRLVAEQYGLQNPATQLMGLHLFPPEMSINKLEPVAMRVITGLRGQAEVWKRIEDLSAEFLTPRRMARVFDSLLPGESRPERVAYIQRTDGVTLIAQRHVLHLLKEFFNQSTSVSMEWVDQLSDFRIGEVHAEAGLNLLRRIRKVEDALAKPLPDFPHAEALLQWYVETGHHGLELLVARAWGDLHACGDGDLVEEGRRRFFGEEGDTNPSVGSLRDRVRARLDEIDRILADFIRANPRKFMQGPRSAAGLIRQRLDEILKRLALGALDGRVWIVIFDGMRYDTWDEVVRPAFSGHFEIDAQPYFTVLPTFTLYARSSLLGGCLPGEGMNNQGEPTTNESILVAKNLGFSPEEAKTRLRFVTDAETTAALMKVGFKDKDVRDVNVLIYPVSDDCHDFNGDLAAFNHRIRAAIIGDKTQGVRGILDDLQVRVRPEDTLLLTSDHGFIELLRPQALSVAEINGGGDAAKIQPRYMVGQEKKVADPSLSVTVGNGVFQLPVGSVWFKREGRASPRYSHGGCSMAEMVIPGAVLNKITGKIARPALESVPTQIVVEEDAVADVSVVVRNAGNVDLSLSVKLQDNFGEVVALQEATLPVGQKLTIAGQLTGKYRETAAREIDPKGTVTSVGVRVHYTDVDGKRREFEEGMVVIPVRVKPKATRLEADALKSFDDM
jgi:hypothetical protein